MRSSLGADQRIERNAMGQVDGVYVTRQRMTAIRSKCGFSRDVFGLELERSCPEASAAAGSATELGRPVEHAIDVAGRTLRERAYQWDPDRSAAVDHRFAAGRGALRARRARPISPGRATPTVPPNCACPTRSATCSAARIARTARYGPAGQLLESVDEHGRTTVFAYDAEGNLIEKLTQHGRVLALSLGRRR